MKTTWVLVADSEKARLFEFERCQEPWKETACLVNPETPHGEGAGRPTRVHESVGRARHAIEPRTDAKDKAMLHFASSIAATLQAAHEARRFHALVLVAAPRFLGALHRQMDKALLACVSREVRHNLTSLDSSGLRGYLLG
jgi:protein required for attachment to host cells